jgi:hypothetical protein
MKCEVSNARPGETTSNQRLTHAIVAQTDRESCQTRHGTVNSILSQLHTVQTVGSICWDRSNHV